MSLTNAVGQAIPFDRTDSESETVHYEATPPSLDSGSYTAEWRGLSSDGHPAQGRFGFTVT